MVRAARRRVRIKRALRLAGVPIPREALLDFSALLRLCIANGVKL